jgi:hypothetical protein
MGGVFPTLGEIIVEFEKMVIWKQSGNDDIPEPTPGLDSDFDLANSRCDQIKQYLDDYLNDVKV